MFQGTKIKAGLHEHNIFPAMHGWVVLSNNKRLIMQKKKKKNRKEKKKINICKIDLFHLNKLNHQLFLQIFSQVF